MSEELEKAAYAVIEAFSGTVLGLTEKVALWDLEIALAAPQAEPVAWLDDQNKIHRSPRFHFLGLVDETCGSNDCIWSGTSLTDAGEAWVDCVERGSKDVVLTGWNCGILATHDQIERQFGRPRGTFSCPICDQETPHPHSPEEVDSYRKDEKWHQEFLAEEWKKIESRVADLGHDYPPRIPLYAVPQFEPTPRGYEWIHKNGHAMLTYDAEWKPFMAQQMSEERAAGYTKYPLYALAAPQAAPAPNTLGIAPESDQRMGQAELIAAFSALKVARDALRALSFSAQTTGGTADRDEGLCRAIDQATEALKAIDALEEGRDAS